MRQNYTSCSKKETLPLNKLQYNDFKGSFKSKTKNLKYYLIVVHYACTLYPVYIYTCLQGYTVLF